MKNKLLFGALLIVGTSFGQTIPGLVAHYNFNASNGTDQVAPQANAILTSALSMDDHFGNKGLALYHNNAASSVNCGTPPKALFTSGLTISAWVNPASNFGDEAIVSKWAGITNTDQYLFMTSNGKLKFAVGKPGMVANGHLGNATLNLNTWYHVVASWDTSGLHEIYINGVLDLSVTDINFKTINNTSSTPLYIGSQLGTSRHYSGGIDEVKLFNRKLNPSEISQLYNEPNIINNNLVSQYNFNADGIDQISGNNAAIINPTFVNDRFSNPNGALDVAASSTYVNLYDSYDGFSTPNGLGQVTYSFWINFKSGTTGYQMILSKSADAGCSSNEREFLFRKNSSNFLEIASYGSLTSGNNRVLQTQNALNDGQWYHVALTYDNSITTSGGDDKFKVYLNGTNQPLQGVSTLGFGIGTGFLDGTTCLAIGGYLRPDSTFCVNTQRLDAYFDDLNVYNKALSGTEVQNLYNAQSTVGILEWKNQTTGLCFPNPTGGLIRFAEDVKEISLTDVSGKIIITDKNVDQLDLSALKNGLYFLMLKDGNGNSRFERLIKQ